MFKKVKVLTPIDYFFIGILIYVLIVLNSKINHFDGWAIGDWLIHYQDGGYKRRGLAGTFFVFLAQYIPIKILLLSFLGGIYSVFLYTLNQFLKSLKINFNAYFLLFLPWVLSYIFFDKAVVGRKEILLFLYFLIIGFKYPFKKEAYNWLVLSFYFILIFVHELSFFFLPFVGLLILISSPNRKKAIMQIMYLLVGSALIMFSFIEYGHEINCGRSIENLKQIGYPIICEGRLNDCSIFSWVQAQSFLNRFQTGLVGLLEYILAYAAYIFIISRFIVKTYRTKFLILMVLFTLFSMPLFYLGIDWGRWMNIHLVLTVFLLLKKNELIKEDLLEYKSYGLIYLICLLILVGHSSDGLRLFF